jgi:hypothetical protein
METTNMIWDSMKNLRNNLSAMKKYKGVLEENSKQIERRIKSSHAGIRYDYRTIENPRKHATTFYPTEGLVYQSQHTFH